MPRITRRVLIRLRDALTEGGITTRNPVSGYDHGSLDFVGNHKCWRVRLSSEGRVSAYSILEGTHNARTLYPVCELDMNARRNWPVVAADAIAERIRRGLRDMPHPPSPQAPSRNLILFPGGELPSEWRTVQTLTRTFQDYQCSIDGVFRHVEGTIVAPSPSGLRGHRISAGSRGDEIPSLEAMCVTWIGPPPSDRHRATFRSKTAEPRYAINNVYWKAPKGAPRSQKLDTEVVEAAIRLFGEGARSFRSIGQQLGGIKGSTITTAVYGRVKDRHIHSDVSLDVERILALTKLSHNGSKLRTLRKLRNNLVLYGIIDVEGLPTEQFVESLKSEERSRLICGIEPFISETTRERLLFLLGCP